ncbi:MAG TPA: bifunctional DNA-formamidopyrimidine glycosylase/DNA-(apurinic or apyrimidinic site) lyase [Bryobacteraceae bacterium]|nr:bifunctional DNA-formamidopyrimidine glycosylase/DNA-(apurinic or apyrimidinic site) lyase [Bryobacteraceae bacterium]
MPELPEVEAICRKLRAEALGARIVRLHIERPSAVRPQSVDAVEGPVAGRVLDAVIRRGKNILLHLSGGLVVRVHLRMTGKLYVAPDVRFRPASTRAWMELDGGRGLVFADSRALGKLHLHTAAEMEGVLDGVGMEPLSPEFTLAWFLEVAGRSRKPAKLFLMDQQHIAGLGNIYAAEALHRARVNPVRPLAGLRRPKLQALYTAIREVVEEAVGSAVLAYSEPGRFEEAEGFSCAVYGREGEPCFRCGRSIRRIRQGGRSTYYCPGCQR